MKFFILHILTVGCILFPLMVHSTFAQSTAQRNEILDAGTITGSVRLKDQPTAYEPMEITKDSKYCGKIKPSPRLIVGKNNGIQNAIVYLQDFTALEKTNETFKVTLDQKKCEYVPHIIIVPPGAQLDILNSDPILHNVHAYEIQSTPKSIFNIAQPKKGQRTTIKRTLINKRGIVEATCDAGHPWMSAYIMVASHSYYTITDKNGEYKLENVPPGNYKVAMWHEGVKVIGKEIENGSVKKYHFEEPYELVQEIELPPQGNKNINFEFVLR